MLSRRASMKKAKLGSSAWKNFTTYFQATFLNTILGHIICDNSSTDGTIGILKKIVSVHPYIRVILNSRNFGILKNTYDGVMSTSDDAAAANPKDRP
jgi:glycosyltransferase involved in cell wall biosynthesis